MINPKETWKPLDWKTAVYSDGIMPRLQGCIVTLDQKLAQLVPPQPQIPAFRFYGQGQDNISKIFILHRNVPSYKQII